MFRAQQQQASTSASVRGVHRIWDPRVWGTIVGGIGATVFVLANRSALASPWPTVALLAWAVAFLAYVWFVFGERRTFAEMGPVGARAGLVYLISVIGMLALIRVGTLALDGADRGELRPALIVLAVGLHFLPFARAFHTPMFLGLGALMAVLGASGLVLGWVWDERAAAVSAVLTGIAMLVVIAGDATRARPPTTAAG